MIENKRYFSIDYDEEYYIFDSTKISKEEVLEKAEYSYDVFGDSLNSDEICDLLNEQEETIQDLKTRNKRQYNLLTEITDLMRKRDWKGLEKIIEDREACERLLQAEWRSYGDVE